MTQGNIVKVTITTPDGEVLDSFLCEDDYPESGQTLSRTAAKVRDCIEGTFSTED